MVSTSASATSRWSTPTAVVALCTAATIIAFIDRANLSVAAIPMQAQFGWSESTKGFVLSSFFIGYIMLQVVSGGLVHRFGGKRLLGVAVVFWSLCTLVTPAAATLSLTALIVVRIALGLGESAVFPACMHMVGHWVPKTHRSRAVAMITSGVSIGTVVSLPLTGWLIRGYGWPMPFYIFSVFGIVWAYVWWRRIPSGSGVEQTVSANAPIPWRRLLSTRAVWAIIVSHFCHNWSLYVLLAWLPSYFKSTFGVTLTNAGLLSAAPPLTSFVMANVAGGIADRMIASGRSVTYVRKLMQSIGMFGVATFLLLVPLADSALMGMVLMCCAAGTLAFSIAGSAPNCFDIAPQYADVIWGISNTFATIPGIVGVAATGWLVQSTGSYAAAFVLTASIAVAGGMVFLVAGSGVAQAGLGAGNSTT